MIHMMLATTEQPEVAEIVSSVNASKDHKQQSAGDSSTASATSESTMMSETYYDCPSPATSRTTVRPIIRKLSLDEDMYVKDEEGCWKSLPAPDMSALRQQRASSSSLAAPTPSEEAKAEDAPAEDAATETSATATAGVSTENPKKLARQSSSSVSFGDIKIRNYERIIADSTNLGSEPAVQLDWSFEEDPTVTVEDYEKVRGPRRTLEHLFLSFDQRSALTVAPIEKEELDELARYEQEMRKRASNQGCSIFMRPFKKLEKALAKSVRKQKQKNQKSSHADHYRRRKA